jgi:ribonuclease HI
MPQSTIEVCFDGLCQPCNPRGIACFLIKKQQNIIHSQCGLAAEPFRAGATNNVAEYTAITQALEWLLASNNEKENIAI